MALTRRDLSMLLPALLAAARVNGAESEEVLPSACYQFDKLPVKKNANGSVIRQVFTGETHEHCPIDLHITTLPPGGSPHPPHTHPHEEMMFIQDGTVEMTIAGKSTKLGPGGVTYVHSGELHGLKNPGSSPATYFVLAIGHQVKAS